MHRLPTHLNAVLASFALAPSALIADTVDDFDSYSSDSAIQAKWTNTLGTQVVTVETGDVFQGSKAMRVTGEFSQVFQVIKFTFDSAQDWSSATSVKVKFKGSASNPAADIKMQVLSTASASVVTEDSVGSGTTALDWSDLTVPLSGQANLDSVIAIQIAIGPQFSGTAIMKFDNLVVDLPSVNGELTITETGGATAITEGGTTDVVNVSLASAPGADVVITPIFDSDQVTVTPSSRTVTPGSWQTPVSFTCTAADDDDIEEEHTTAISFSSSSGDSSFDGVSTGNLSIVITDNDFLIDPVITNFDFDGSDIKFTIPTQTNQQYSVEESSTLLPGSWTTRIGPITGLAGPLNICIPANETLRYFRVLTEPLP